MRVEHIRRVYDIAQGEGVPAYASVLVAVALYTGLRKEGLSQLAWRQGKPEEPGTLDRQGETWVFFIQEKGKHGNPSRAAGNVAQPPRRVPCQSVTGSTISLSHATG